MCNQHPKKRITSNKISKLNQMLTLLAIFSHCLILQEIQHDL